MVANGHPLVIGEQRIVGAEHGTDIRGVMHRGIKVGVIPHLRWQEQLGVLLWHQGVLGDLLPVHRTVLMQQRHDRVAQGAPGVCPQRHERIECR